VLNNDVIVKDDHILDKLLHYFDDPGVGGVTPQILEYPDTDSAWFIMMETDIRSDHSIHHQFISKEFDDPIENDYIPFCSSLFSTKVFEEYGVYPTNILFIGKI
jgi:GT2 family glycosyltransferase